MTTEPEAAAPGLAGEPLEPAPAGRPAARGFRAFFVLWIGQTVSLFGSGLTGFALGVWIYQKTGSATGFGLILFFAVAPLTVLSPLLGVLIDRFDRRWVMIASDVGATANTLVLALLLWSDRLHLWHICVLTGLTSVLRGVRYPALQASISLLVPREELGRANGMVEFGNAASTLAAPLAAGFLIQLVHLHGVILIDFATFAFAMVTLLVVRIPSPPGARADAAESRGSLARDLREGWTYLRGSRVLIALLAVSIVANFAIGTVQSVINPLVLSFASAAVLGVVTFVAGCGMLVGGLTMAVWGGPKRRLLSVQLAALAVQGAMLVVGGLRANVWLIGGTAFLYLFAIAFSSTCAQSIWQRTVPPILQGRVFSLRQMVGNVSVPFAYLVSGPLCDHVFTPLLLPGGRLSASVGPLLGVGPGRGIGLLFVALGLLLLTTVLAATAYEPLRAIEREPDGPSVAADPNRLQ